MNNSMVRVLVVLPAYNENLGVRAAVRAGMLLALREGFEVVVHCDADGQHRPSDIPHLIAGLDSRDVVIGARFAGKGEFVVRDAPAAAVRLLAALMSRVHPQRLIDVTSKYRAFGPRAIAVMSAEMPRDHVGDTVEDLIVARENGLRVGQVPVSMRARQGGRAQSSAVPDGALSLPGEARGRACIDPVGTRLSGGGRLSAEPLVAVTAILVILVVLRLVASRRLLVEYAILWLLVSLAMGIMGAIPDSVEALSDLAGPKVPPNFQVFAALGLLLSVNLRISGELTKVERQVQRLAEEIAVLGEHRGRER